MPQRRIRDGHHDKKTYDGWALVAGSGKRPMVPPDDPRHPGRVRQPPDEGEGMHEHSR